MYGAFDRSPLVSALLSISRFLSSQLDKEKLERIPILQRLRTLEEQAGTDVTLGATSFAAERGVPTGSMAGQKIGECPEGTSKHGGRAQLGQKARQLPDRETKEITGQDRTGQERGKRSRGGNRKERGQEEGGREVTPRSFTTVYLGGIPAGLRVSELKSVLREREAVPLRLTWQGAQHRAFLDYSDPQDAEHALEALQELSVKGCTLQAEVAKSQRGDKRSGQSRHSWGPETTSPPNAENNTTEVAEQQQQQTVTL